MTAQTDTSRDEIIARNLAAVETHFHNETPETIDQAIAVYTDDIVWEVPARGLVLRSIEDVKQEYLKIFGSMNIHKIINLHRFANEEWVFDDSIFEWTITGDGFRNCPYPPGTTVSVRLLHAFQCRDGKICREHGYEIWRDINDHARVKDDIPATATGRGIRLGVAVDRRLPAVRDGTGDPRRGRLPRRAVGRGGRARLRGARMVLPPGAPPRRAADRPG